MAASACSSPSSSSSHGAEPVQSRRHPHGWCLRLASEHGIDPALHRVAVMSAGTLDSLPHNGAVVTLLAVCGVTHRDSYKDIFVVAIVGALLALAAVIVLGS